MSKRYIYPQVTFVVDYIYVALSHYTTPSRIVPQILMSVLRLEYRRIFQITDVSWIQPQSADEVMDIVFAF
jgi:hypothetical protein